VATAFGIDDATLRRWSRAWEREGTDGLRPDKLGPKRASKLTDELAETIRGLRRDGKSLAVIAQASGVSTDTVRRAIAGASSASDQPPEDRGLVPLPGRSPETPSAPSPTRGCSYAPDAPGRSPVQEPKEKTQAHKLWVWPPRNHPAGGRSRRVWRLDDPQRPGVLAVKLAVEETLRRLSGIVNSGCARGRRATIRASWCREIRLIGRPRSRPPMS